MLEAVLLEHVSKMGAGKEQMRHILQFYFVEGGNAVENCATKGAYENRLRQLFINSVEGLYASGIMKVPRKWQQFVEQNVAYLN